MADIIGQVLNGLLWVLGITAIGLGFYFVYFTMQYKHRAVIKDSVNGTKMVRIDRFREIRKKDGTIWWKFKKLKVEVTPALKECIEVDNKGRMYAQFYRLDGDTFIPAKDTFDLEDAETKDVIKTLQPFGNNERALMINQHIKAEREKKKNIGDMIAAAIPYMAVIMILVLFMIFFDDAVKPMKEVGAQYSEVADNLAITTDRLEAIIHDRMVLDNEDLPKEDDTGGSG